jgi:hypothetical protein
MNELQILFRLNELNNKLPLSLALEAMGQVVFTMETLDEEGHEYDMDILIEEALDFALNEL